MNNTNVKIEDEFVDDVELERATKKYLIQSKLRRWTICTFVLSMVALVSIAALYFFILLEEVVAMSIETLLYVHSFNRIADLAQVKKNDFAFSQHELYVSSQFLVDLLSDWRFNRKSLGGPDLDNLDRFNKYSQNMMIMVSNTEYMEKYTKDVADCEKNRTDQL